MSNFNKKSLAWKFFTDLGNVRASCNICGKVLSYRGGGPFNLTRHTKVKHPDEYEIRNTLIDSKPNVISRKTAKLKIKPTSTKIKKKYISNNFNVKKAESQNATSSKSFYLKKVESQNESIPDNFYERKDEIQNDPLNDNFYERKDEIQNEPIPESKPANSNIELIKLITKQYLDLNIVESKEFKGFVNKLNSNYHVPSRYRLSYELLTDCYKMTKERVKNSLQQANYVSLTTDCWSSSTANESYISLTAHFLDEKTEMQSCLLECCQFAEGQNLSIILATICDDWDITDKVVAVNSHNDDNLKEAIYLNHWTQITCIAQTINLAVQLALQNIEDTQIKVRSIVELFQNSPTATEELQEMQLQLEENPNLKLKQGLPTRWTSTYELFEQVLSIKNSLSSILSSHFPEEESISIEDINIMSYATELLSYFKDFIEEIRSQNNVIISEVILISNGLIKQIEKFLSKGIKIPICVKNMGEFLLTEMSEHFNEIEFNDLFASSTLLDPRFKKYGFSNDLAFEEAYTNLKALVSNDPLKDDELEGELLIPMNSRKSGIIWQDFDEKVNEVIKSSDPLTDDELDDYLKEPLLHRSKSPLKWWNDRKTIYPKMYEIVKKRLCIIANSVPGELLFSEIGQNVIKRRNMLNGNCVPQFVFLNFNM
ncbi:E3 SUMO-protein ligase ZBED1-like isoform X2 [Episyrphus balteatus]|nr:E3 SUMO-protein ligase ZBED1-like isoform X2 [Episyrphus balteatus]XP_055845419.1 E3 SUMO-protein ligase ZBED1-like isoform X2 [Episyrphus balteatus]XP_055845420.1 E3 SUMO-protein ligase ZBED1-like isoform X2 [Episyrphus balteatus]XP_055845421.1 E3 SUMO-protein ligase ZBED1-like isoform X2 [Episyrphus balteatus]XP_055845422.1 E3 SUMO-protein ligase ZBED1-like isoform X2 [Episyrphus balteatus]